MSPADRLVRNGTLAHRMAQLFVAAGLRDVHVEAATLVVRDPTDVDGVLGLRDWPAHGAERSIFTQEEARAWERQLDAAAAGGTFLYAVTFFLTSGRAA